MNDLENALVRANVQAAMKKAQSEPIQLWTPALLRKGFNPDQERDENGRWAGGAAASAAASAASDKANAGGPSVPNTSGGEYAGTASAAQSAEDAYREKGGPHRVREIQARLASDRHRVAAMQTKDPDRQKFHERKVKEYSNLARMHEQVRTGKADGVADLEKVAAVYNNS